MTELVILLLVAIAVATRIALTLVWRFILWATRPIRDEIAYRRVVKEELQKEECIIVAHREAVQQIDNAVAFYLDRHEQEPAGSDDEPGRRQSDPSSEDTISVTREPDPPTSEPLQVVEAAPAGYYWSWYVHPVTGKITVSAGRRKNTPTKHP